MSVVVKIKSGEYCEEILVEDDHDIIPLSRVVECFPDAVKLKYEDSTGSWIDVQFEADFFMAPDDGWGERCYHILDSAESSDESDSDDAGSKHQKKSTDSEPRNELKAKKIEKEQHEIRQRKTEGMSQEVKQDQKVKPVKESSKVQPNSTQSKGQNTSNIYFFLIIVVLGVLMVVVTMVGFQRLESHNYNTIDTFTEKLNNMKGVFKGQHKVYWNLLKNSGTKHLKRIHNDDQRDLTPQSYLIAGYVGSEDTLKCFVKSLGDVFANNVSHINSEDYSNTDDKAILYEHLASKLEGINKVVVFENIEKLKFGAAQLFMSFSDEHNQVAKYPQSLLLLTTILPFGDSQNRKADEHKTADYFKEEVWKNVNVDLTAPLWSRVGNGLIIIQKEDGLSC